MGQQPAGFGHHVERPAHHDAVVGPGPAQGQMHGLGAETRPGRTPCPVPWRPRPPPGPAGPAASPGRRPRPTGRRRPAAPPAWPTGSRPESMPDHGHRPRPRRRTPRPATGPAPACRPRCGHRRPPPAGGGPPPRGARAPATVANASSTTSVVERCPEEGLDRGQGHRGVVTLVGPVQRHQQLAVGRGRGPHVDEAPTHGHPVGGAAEVVAADPDLGGAGGLRPPGAVVATSVGSVSPTTTRLPGLMMPALSRAMSSRVGPSTSVWSKLTLVRTATSASTTLVQSQRPPKPTSTTATSTASSANQARAAAVRSSNRVGGSSISGSRRASASSTSANAVVVDGLAVAGQALVDPGQVGAGVGADGQPLGAEQRGGHGRRRALAVGAGDVDGGNGLLGIAQQARQAPASGRGVGRARRRGHGRLEVDVGVEPGQGLGKIVEGHGVEQDGRYRIGARWRRAAGPQEAARRLRVDLAGALFSGTRVGWTRSSTTARSTTHLADVGAAGQVVHHLEQHLFEDGPQAPGPGPPQQGLLGHGLEGVVGELELDVVELEDPLVLTGQRVLRLDEDLDQRVLVEMGDRARPRGGDR